MNIFKPGSQYLYKGRLQRVDYVLVQGYTLKVHLVGFPDPCRAEELSQPRAVSQAQMNAHAALRGQKR